MKRSFASIILLLLMLASGGQAAEYILRVPAGKLSATLSRYGLSVLDRVSTQEVYLVQGPDGVKPASNDDQVSLEPNDTGTLQELAPGTLPLIGSISTAQVAIYDQNQVSFYGNNVWKPFVQQGVYTKVRLNEVHSSLATGTQIVAIIDTGIDPDHPALRNALVSGYDFTRNVAGYPSELDDLDEATRAILSPFTTAILDTVGNINPFTTAILDHDLAARLGTRQLPQGFGHGTMVAGIIHRVAPTARIMPLKPFGANGRASLFNIVRAIYYAQANGARVINMSLSLPKSSRELERSINYVSSRGVICVASAGNQGRDMLVWPAALERVVGVASTTITDRRSSFSNHGDNGIHVGAPGESIVTTFPGGRYAAAWGTSFSAPIVSGGIALMLQVKPTLGWEWAHGALSEASPVNDSNLGSGRVDLWRAVRKATEF